MAEQKKEEKKPVEVKRGDEQQEQESTDLPGIICVNLAQVMRSPKNMPALEAMFDEWIKDQAALVDLGPSKNDFRQQIQRGRLALESLESRLMHTIG